MQKKIVLMMGTYFLMGSSFSQHRDSLAIPGFTELDPVTVTSAVVALPSSKTGRNILSLPGELFNRLPIHSIDDLLKYIPGIELQMRGPEGSQSDIVIRGATFEQVLVIVDGVRVNDPNTGHFNSIIPLAPAEIDHIEILKGSSSGIYGSEAVGGVIYIITKTFAARQGDGKAGVTKALDATATVGDYDLINGNAGASYSNGKTSVAGGWLSNNSAGQLQRGTRGFFHNNTASLSFKQMLGKKWSIAARSAFDSRNFSAQNFYTTFLSDTANERVKTLWNQLQAQYVSNKNILTIDGGYRNTNDHYQFNPSSIANENHSSLLQWQVSDNIRVNASMNWVGGVQLMRKWIRSNDRGNHLINQAAAYLLLNKSLNRLSISPALRLDYNDQRSAELVPQLNVSYRVSALQLRGSAGKTIRDPDFTELYNNYNQSFVSGGSIGNPGLQPERSFSYEAGADYFTKLGLKVSATVFRRNENNVIDWIATSYADMPRKANLSPAGTYALASNIAKLNTTGLEADLQYARQFERGGRIAGALGFVWLNDKSNEPIPSFYISSHAKLLTNFNMAYSCKRFSLTATGIYKHRQPQAASAIDVKIAAAYFLMNAQLSIFLIDQKLSVFAEADNLFNSRNDDLLGAQLPGRWTMAGFKLNLWKRQGIKPGK